MSNEYCSKCIFFYEDAETDDYGFKRHVCRRFPPNPKHGFPRVNRFGWCGEYLFDLDNYEMEQAREYLKRKLERELTNLLLKTTSCKENLDK